MTFKPHIRLLTATASSIVLLLVFLLLPLIKLMSMHLGIGDVLHKIPRLVHGMVSQAVAYVLLLGMVASPLAVAACAALKRSLRAVCLLPAAFSLVLAVILMVTSQPLAPSYGLWIYLFVALVMAFLLRK